MAPGLLHVGLGALRKGIANLRNTLYYEPHLSQMLFVVNVLAQNTNLPYTYTYTNAKLCFGTKIR